MNRSIEIKSFVSSNHRTSFQVKTNKHDIHVIIIGSAIGSIIDGESYHYCNLKECFDDLYEKTELSLVSSIVSGQYVWKGDIESGFDVDGFLDFVDI